MANPGANNSDQSLEVARPPELAPSSSPTAAGALDARDLPSDMQSLRVAEEVPNHGDSDSIVPLSGAGVSSDGGGSNSRPPPSRRGGSGHHGPYSLYLQQQQQQHQMAETAAAAAAQQAFLPGFLPAATHQVSMAPGATAAAAPYAGGTYQPVIIYSFPAAPSTNTHMAAAAPAGVVAAPAALPAQFAAATAAPCGGYVATAAPYYIVRPVAAATSVAVPVSVSPPGMSQGWARSTGMPGSLSGSPATSLQPPPEPAAAGGAENGVSGSPRSPLMAAAAAAAARAAAGSAASISSSNLSVGPRMEPPPGSGGSISSTGSAGGRSSRGERQACAFFLKTGTCAWGDRCKFEHPYDKAPRVEFNSLGLPLRPSEPTCAYYLKHMSCAFGHTCKFHHPELPGTAAAAAAVGHNEHGPHPPAPTAIAPVAIPPPFGPPLPAGPVDAYVTYAAPPAPAVAVQCAPAMAVPQTTPLHGGGGNGTAVPADAAHPPASAAIATRPASPGAARATEGGDATQAACQEQPAAPASLPRQAGAAPVPLMVFASSGAARTTAPVVVEAVGIASPPNPAPIAEATATEEAGGSQLDESEGGGAADAGDSASAGGQAGGEAAAEGPDRGACAAE